MLEQSFDRKPLKRSSDDSIHAANTFFSLFLTKVQEGFLFSPSGARELFLRA